MGQLKKYPSLSILPLLLILVAIVIKPSFSSTKAVISEAPLPADSTRFLRLVFAGDVMQHDPQIKAAFNETTQTYDYDSCFVFCKNYIQSADLAIANLETTLAGKPYTGYPQFSAPDELAKSLKNTGFDILLTANNHSVDKYKKGIERTIDVLDSLAIKHTGTFKNAEQRQQNYPLIVEKNGFRIAFLNATYGTNGLVPQAPNIVNMIDTTQIKKDLQQLKNKQVDFVIATYHWGNEYEREENKWQRQIAQFSFKENINLIVGSHPHVVQPIKNEQPDSTKAPLITAYSLGNFISNQRNEHTDGGIFFEITLKKNIHTRQVTIHDYGYVPFWVFKRTEGKVGYYVLPIQLFENNQQILNMSQTDKAKLINFAFNTRNLLLGCKEKQINY